MVGEQLDGLVFEALSLALLLASPSLLAAWISGAAAGVLGSKLGWTGSGFVAIPRAVAALVAVAVTMPWLGAELRAFGMRMLSLAVGA